MNEDHTMLETYNSYKKIFAITIGVTFALQFVNLFMEVSPIFDQIIAIMSMYSIFKMMRTKKTKKLKFAFWLKIGGLIVAFIGLMMMTVYIVSNNINIETLEEYMASFSVFILVLLIPSYISNYLMIKQFALDVPTEAMNKLANISIAMFVLSLVLSMTAMILNLNPMISQIVSLVTQIIFTYFVITNYTQEQAQL